MPAPGPIRALEWLLIRVPTPGSGSLIRVLGPPPIRGPIPVPTDGATTGRP